MGKNLQLLFTILTVTILATTLPGCSLLGQETATPVAETSLPVVTIQTPAPEQSFVVAETVLVQSEAVDRRGIVRVELVVNGQVIRIDANSQPEPDTPFIVVQPWTPAVVGSYTVQVNAYNTANAGGQSQVLTLNVVQSAPETEPAETPSGAGGPASVEDSLPTATPEAATTTPAAPTVRPTATPTTSTATTPTAEPTPVPLPTLTYAPTGLTPDGRFKDIWQALDGAQSPLGYPVGLAVEGRDYARQRFERGFMFWWDSPDDENLIWVLSRPADDLQSGLGWQNFSDQWAGGEAYSCPAARQNDELGPVRGFGQIWCDRADLAAEIGQPVEPEAGSGGNAPYAMVQFFQGGVMVYNPHNAEVYVLFSDGRWQRFGY